MSKKNSKHPKALSYLVGISVLLLVICCQSPGERSVIGIEQKTGEQLSKEFCSSCHRYTEPSLLPKAQWKNVLDRMALHLGIRTGVDPYRGRILEEVFLIQQANVFMTEPVMSDSTWQRLVEYYINNAPDHISIPAITDLVENNLFKESLPPVTLGGFPVVTMVKFDTQDHQLYLADLNKQLLRLNADFEEDQITGFLSPVVRMTGADEDHLLMTEIGILNPNDQKTGRIEMTDRKSMAQRSSVLIELIRPVYLETGDIDGDQILDLLVCSFGNLVGDLSWYKYHEGKYYKNTLRDTPGAIQTKLLDIDGDQDLDVIALFGQAMEGVSLFTNNGGNFSERKLLEFDPLFGCSAFQIIDFDQDGDDDLVLANGDNGDYSDVLKPYHGVRIFENDGEWNLKERTFIPINGATGIQVADFDQDADVDLFVHAFYPDFNDGGKASLLYLENQGAINLSSENLIWRMKDVGWYRTLEISIKMAILLFLLALSFLCQAKYRTL
ncbi:MAG: VCBS repeat-containing protein [Saprospiraceae bacterium]|nr:VCBS repeat-containing protein [Saprospiraceae bacterium]